MCTTCGCSDDDGVRVIDMKSGKSRLIGQMDEHHHQVEPQHAHAHSHSHNHVHEHDNEHTHEHEESLSQAVPSIGTIVDISTRILEKNDRLAEKNRAWLNDKGILAINLVSAPGSGKTALLERTINDLKTDITFSVLEGDQATTNDAMRIQKAGCSVIQINTGRGCHLDAEMVSLGLKQLHPMEYSVLMIENVGNLVCPALFDLGEMCKVTILSITEGEDKPVKYPHMFRASELLLLNKIDLLPHLNFDLQICKNFALAINPKITILEISATRGDGFLAWCGWLRNKFATIQHLRLSGLEQS